MLNLLRRYFKIKKTFLLFLTLMYAPLSFAQENPTLQDGIKALNTGDYETAAEKLSEGFKAGEVDGAFYLGRMLELGLGSAPDLKAAIGLYIAGSAKGSAPAKNRLGVLHVRGRGVLQDFEEGAKLVCEAAVLGDMNGSYNCGTVLLQGQGVEKDEAEAYRNLKIAADLGHIGAKNEYANALVEGKYVEKNVTDAIALFEETAARGDAIGLYSLGQAYVAGLGVDRDLVKAHSYLNLAATFSHPKAADVRRTLEQEMTSDQVVSAQQLAKTWQPMRLPKTQ